MTFLLSLLKVMNVLDDFADVTAENPDQTANINMSIRM